MIAPIEEMICNRRDSIAVDLTSNENLASDPANHASAKLVADVVADHPVMALTLAASVGALAGWFVKRKLFQ
ncbi:MAG: hypothetical protein KDB00_09310 [Planctomycetales bacterium]|nr:hypothetical protein [Planctomycetales bacterium]